jgi:hypothetical protein
MSDKVGRVAELDAHPLAEMFPLMDHESITALADDIKQNGLSQPILIYEGLILDGRNRFKACQLAGVDPVFDNYQGDDPLGYVLSLNLHRRHLTTSQRAALAAEIANMNSESCKGNQHRAKLPEAVSRSEAAERLDVSRRYVTEAKKIQRESPEHFEQIKNGHKSISQVKRELNPVVEVDFQESPQPPLIKQYNSAYQGISKFNFILSDVNHMMSSLIRNLGVDLIDDALDHYNQAHALQDLADKCGQLLGQISYIKTLSDSDLDLDQETFPFVSNFTGGKNE